jgi:hypothetical protein
MSHFPPLPWLIADRMAQVRSASFIPEQPQGIAASTSSPHLIAPTSSPKSSNAADHRATLPRVRSNSASAPPPSPHLAGLKTGERPKHDAHEINAALQASYNVTWPQDVVLTPHTGLDYLHIFEDGYQEKAPVLST